MKLFGSLRELVAAVFRKDTYEITLRPNQTTVYSAARDVQLPQQDSNAVLVSRNSSDTLTNKTIDGDDNTLQDVGLSSLKTVLADANKAVLRDAAGAVVSASITNTNIDAAAAIAYSKLSLSGSIVNADISGSASISDTKLATISTAGKVSGAAITSGTIGGTTSISTAGTISANTLTSTGLTTAQKVYVNGTGNDGFIELEGQTVSGVTAPTTGEVRLFAGTDNKIYVRKKGSAAAEELGGGGTIDKVTQVGHGFVLGDVLYLNGSVYTKAIATSAAAAEVIGVVSEVVDADNFSITLSGEVSGLTSLTAGEVYFLSAATAGALTVTEPSVIGQVSVPVGVASSTTSLYVAPKRGIIVGGSDARTELPLLNVTTPQNVQSVSAYEAGELTGWVFISATTSRRFYLSVQFSSNGAGTDYNLSYQTSGDTPPTGFNVTVTTGGQIQVTLASSTIAGFVSAKINYALNAPAVGATFPLSISGNTVVGGTPTVDTVNENTLNNGVQIQGRTSGVAIPSGYIGQKITWSTSPASQALTTTATDWTNASFQLTPGVWEIKGAISFSATTGNVAGNQVAVLAQLTDAANNLAQGQSKSLVFTTGANFACYFEGFIPIFCTVNIATNTTYKLRVYLFNANGSNSGFVLNAGNSRSELYAIRIA